MGIGDILSKSISYPFSDITKFLIIGIGVIIVDLDTVFGELFGTKSFIRKYLEKYLKEYY